MPEFYPSSTSFKFLKFSSKLWLLLCADILYLPEEVDWVKFNVDMSGFYMVHYAGDGWNSMTKLLQHNHTALTNNDRASLIHDVFQLVRSVQLNLLFVMH